MADVQSSPSLAPAYALHRDAIAAVDATAPTNAAYGCNAGMYRYAHVQVVPAGGANPTVGVWWWSEAAGKFIQEHTPLSFAGVGVNVPFEFTIEPRGRKFFVAVTTLAAGTASVYVSGFQHEQASA